MWGGETYRVISDHLGSPMLVVNVNDDGDRPLEATYSAFGEVTGTGLDWMPFGFACLHALHCGAARPCRPSRSKHVALSWSVRSVHDSVGARPRSLRSETQYLPGVPDEGTVRAWGPG